MNLVAGLIMVAMFFWDGARVWGWKLEITPSSLRVRRFFRWADFPWERIRSVRITEESRDRRREVVALTLMGNSTEALGAFDPPFARNLRDRLRAELANRSPYAEQSEPARELVSTR